MNSFDNLATCEHRDELISVLYGEATENETAQFQQHVQECVACRTEMLQFKQVRESIGTWKAEALAGATQPQVNVPIIARHKSAVAAFREFFDLSPSWLKGATAFATLIFFALAVLAFGQLKKPEAPVISKSETKKIYTEQEKDQIVKKALDDQRATLTAELTAKPATNTEPLRSTRSTRDLPRSQVAQGQRPLTKLEREQLASDLRLVDGGNDEDGLKLLADPFNW